MTEPLVTFVSPCYNHSKFVIDSLESIRAQTYSNTEHIIIDDCSTDDSAEKISRWIADNNYPCTFIRHEKNMGISYTLNESIKLAKGEFWSSVATDDIVLPGRTKIFVDLLNKHQAGMIVSDASFINDAGEDITRNGSDSFTGLHIEGRDDVTLESYGSYETLVIGNYIVGSTMVRTNVFEKTGLFNEEMKIEDWDMWLRIARQSKIIYTPEKLLKYRWHDTNTGKGLDSTNRYYIETVLKQQPYCTSRWLRYYFKSRLVAFTVFNKDPEVLKMLKPHLDPWLWIKIYRLRFLHKFKNLLRTS